MNQPETNAGVADMVTNNGVETSGAPAQVKLTEFQQGGDRARRRKFPAHRLRRFRPSPRQDQGQARFEGLEDERHPFYIPMTRSQKFLHMTWAPIADNQQALRASEFWTDILASMCTSGRAAAGRA